MRGRAARLASGVVIVLAWLGVEAASAAAIRGTILNAGPPPERKQIPINIDQYVCGKSKESEDLIVGANRGIRWAVVSMQSPPPGPGPEATAKPVQMDQQQCVYIPRVVVVPVGGTVEFLNNDRLLHNLHSASTENPTFNRTQPKGRTIPMVFKKPEIVRVDCDLHTWMRAWVVVADHPFFAVTGPQGEFVLDNVPPGKYTLKVWHETLGTVTRDVTVGEQDAAGVTVAMGKKEPASGRDGDGLARLPCRRVRRPLDGAEDAAPGEGPGGGGLGVGGDRAERRPGDLRAVDVQRDVTHEVLSQRRMLAAGSHRDGHVEPLAALHRVGSHDLRRVLRVHRAAELLVLRSELLLLSRAGWTAGQGEGDKDGCHGDPAARSGHGSRLLSVRRRQPSGGWCRGAGAGCRAWQGRPRRPRPWPSCRLPRGRRR